MTKAADLKIPQQDSGHPLMRKLLLLAWLPLVIVLFPLPPQTGKQLMEGSYERGTREKSHATRPPEESIKQQARSKRDLDVLVAGLWTIWFQNLGMLALGLFVGVMAWRGGRHWQLFALGMSIFYLALVVYAYLRIERPVPESWLFFGTENHFLRIMQANLRLIEVGISNGSLVRPARVIYIDILMPIFQVVVLVWMLCLLALRREPGTRAT
jgi:hypothetical protein